MIGRRRNFVEGTMPHEMEAAMEAGDYAPCVGIYAKLGWILIAPNGAVGAVSPPVFTIDEHADGSITVGPASILFRKNDAHPEFHGYLHAGVWS